MDNLRRSQRKADQPIKHVMAYEQRGFLFTDRRWQRGKEPCGRQNTQRKKAVGMDHRHGGSQYGKQQHRPKPLPLQGLFYCTNQQEDRGKQHAPTGHRRPLGDQHIADDVDPADILGHIIGRRRVVAGKDGRERIFAEK